MTLSEYSKKEKKGITLREMPFYLLMVFIIATTVLMFIE